mgnify:CR=1 FL=1
MKRRKKPGEGGLTISPLVPAAVLVLVLFGHGIRLLAYVAVLLPHEFAHAYAAEKLGYKAKSIHIAPYGVALEREKGYVRPLDEVKIALAGPLVNIFMAVTLAALWWVFPPIYSGTKYIAEASLFTAVVNLLPVYPMDGGRALRGVIEYRSSRKTACAVSRIVGICVGVAAVAGALALLVSGIGPAFATLGIFILASLAMPAAGEYGRIYALDGLSGRLRKGLPVREIMVSGECTLCELFSMLRPGAYTRFAVCDGRKVVFTVEEWQLEEFILRFSCDDTVISVAKSEAM